MNEQLNLFGQPIKNKDWFWHLKDLENVKKNGLKVASAFACGGGSSMGYKLAGCNVIADIEIDVKMNELYVLNHNPKYNYLMDIRDFNKIDNSELPKELFDLDIFDASPPCSTFSMAGDREKAWGVEKKLAFTTAELCVEFGDTLCLDTSL